MEISTQQHWSHKLKASLATILVQAKRLQCDPLKPHQQKRVRNIITESAYLLRLVNGIIKDTESNDSPLATSKAARRKPSINILLVEDFPILQKIHSLMLHDLGYSVDVVGTAWEALARFDKHYDLILMDISLPDKSGIEITKKIRAHEQANKTKPVPIIMLTSHREEGIKQESLRAGANDFLTKPISSDELNKTISHWLPIKQRQKM